MAVRHGYGKIAGADALVFAYDTVDTRNSYRGEPTTNLITDTAAFDSSFWNQKSGTITANDQVGPRGLQNAAKIVATNTDPYIYSSAVVTASTGNVTWSIWVKGAGNTIGKSAQVRINFSGTATGTADTDASVNLTSNWQLLQTTANVTGAGTIKFGLEAPNSAVSGDIMYFADPMFEQKSHATQFTTGTRSVTQGLLDLTGRNSIDLTNASFNSDAQIEFDGTNSYIQTNFGDNITSEFTAEFIFYATTNQTHFPMQMFVSADANTVFRVERYSAGASTIEFGHSENGGAVGAHELISFNFPNNTWHHCTLVYDGTYKYIYKNGVVDTSVNDPTITWYSGATLRIGARQNSSLLPIAGYMPMVKIYNRALTPNEIRNNYNFYKGRYGI